MRAYRCDRCPLVFKVGGYHYWDLTGRCEQVVCTACGTMHRLEEQHGVCRVLALPGPVRHLPLVKKVDATGYEYEDYEWPFSPGDWREVSRAADASAFERLACSRCGAAGSLVSLEWPEDADGNWPAFGDQCPVCGGPLPWVYDRTAN